MVISLIFQLGSPPSAPAAPHLWNTRVLPASQTIGVPMSALVIQWLINPRMTTAMNTRAAP